MRDRPRSEAAGVRACAWTIALLWILLARPAAAGGPLLIQDPATRTPFAYTALPVPVFTDLGSLGVLSGETADSLTVAGFAAWSSVGTSTFDAVVVAGLDSLGIADVDSSNAELVIGTFNGGGIHVLYDDDGSILRDVFGLPPGVLGVASPEFAVGAEIQESWVVLSGPRVDPSDTTGARFAGVFTHEFGHSINLGHSQTNGAMIFFGDDTGPTTCETPYLGFPGAADIETMYPFIDVLAGGTGPDVATVEHPDDVASLSDLYPAGNWPSPRPVITGTVFGIDGVTELTGINVIARDVLDPFAGAVSSISGDFTQGDLGPDGLFTLTGLRSGREYVLYVDRLVAGTFSTPPGVLGADEEYWDLAEAGDRVNDPPCNVSTIVLGNNETFVADIHANAVPPPTIGVSPATVQLIVPQNTQEFRTVTLANEAPFGADDLFWTVADRPRLARGAASAAGARRFAMAKARAHVEPTAPEFVVPERKPVAQPLAPLQRAVDFAAKAGGVLDGGFELGGVWTASSTNFFTPICDLALCGTGSGSGPRSGDAWAWFGGFSGGLEQASLSQSVVVPAGGASLVFHLEQSRCDSPADVLDVLVDGVTVFSRNGGAPSCGQLGYERVVVDLAAFADGGVHTLEFRAETSAVNGGATNFFVDDVDVVGSECPWLEVFPQSGILAPGDTEFLDLSVSALGIAPGSYSCDLVIESNASPDSVRIVPLELDVVGSVIMQVRTRATESATVMVLPDGTGDSFAEAQAWDGVPGSTPTRVDASIEVTLEDLDGAPVVGFPARAVDLVSSLGGLTPCVDDSTADADTDALGRTGFVRARRAGGATEPDLDEVLQIELDTVFVAEATYGDPVLYGSGPNGRWFTVDVTTGQTSFVCSLPSAATEVEYDKTTGRAWVQEPDTGYTLRRFSPDDCVAFGGGVPTGTTFDALEMIGGDLYGVASPNACSNSSLRILDPDTGTAVVLGPTGIGPVSGLAWDRAGGILYGVTGCSQAVPPELVTFNLFTGAATSVGFTGVSLASLQFGPDGLLYAGGDADDGGNLYRLDPLTGAATLVGATGETAVTGLTLVSPAGLDIQVNSPDVVPDGAVDLVDLGQFAALYDGEYTFQADFARDGVLSIADVGIFASAFGSGCAPDSTAAPAAAAAEIRVVFDPVSMTDRADLPAGTWTTVHVMIAGRVPATAWSGRLEVSPNVEIASWELGEGAINLAEAPTFVVGRAGSGATDAVLMTARVRVTDTAPARIAIVPVDDASSVRIAIPSPDGAGGSIAAATTRSAFLNAGDDDVPRPGFAGYALRAAPNPFNPSTRLHFELPRAGRVAVEIFDTRGRLVRTLGPYPMSPGAHEILWRGLDGRGRRVNSGLYFGRLRLDDRPVGSPAKIQLIK